MKKLKLSQAEIDKLVVVERRVVKATVHGVGLLDVDFVTKISGASVWQLELWRGMLKRCFSKGAYIKNPTYVDVTVCDEWLSFANFIEWCNKEVGYKGKPVGLELDKDILAIGNKVYSKDTCCFVPPQINLLFCATGAKRGKYPIGVIEVKGRFVARLKMYGRKVNVGGYDTPERAFQAYKIAKEAHVKSMALQYKDVLRPDVFDALMAWQVDIFS